MAKIATSIKKLGIEEAFVYLTYDSQDWTSKVSLHFVGPLVGMELVYLRSGLDFSLAVADTDRDKQSIIDQAKEMAGTCLDVGRSPYGIGREPFWRDLDANDVWRAAGLQRAIGKAKAYDPERKDELVPTIDALRKLGLPVSFRYISRKGHQITDAARIPDEFKGQTAKFLADEELLAVGAGLRAAPAAQAVNL